MLRIYILIVLLLLISIVTVRIVVNSCISFYKYNYNLGLRSIISLTNDIKEKDTTPASFNIDVCHGDKKLSPLREAVCVRFTALKPAGSI